MIDDGGKKDLLSAGNYYYYYVSDFSIFPNLLLFRLHDIIQFLSL